MKMENCNDNDIVISGIAGRFPESDDVQELWNNLMSGGELSSIDERRWPLDVFDIPKRSGKIKNLEKFDAEYFSVEPNKADTMDPQVRLLHETIWEAIFDAGFIPESLRGSKTSVCVGACFADTLLALAQNIEIDSFIHSTVAQISHSFDFRGPAFLVDTACASSFSAFCEGTLMLKKSLCDQLIVSGLSVTLNPAISFGFKNMRMIAEDGRSKCLDRDVNGYCRSESVVSLFLQKRKNAKRIYASIINVKTNTDGYKQEGITFPRSESQRRLMSETIKAANLNPNDVNYIEAHMTGTAAGDPAESKAIIEGYRPNGSEKPLNFGCLKSNLGHTEGASGCLAITKVCLAFQKRCLPPNLNFKNPNPDIEPLMKGIIKPVIKACDFNEDIVPVNSFGFGGVNVHGILKANEKSVLKTPSRSIFNDMPRIITVSGRTAEAVDFIFKSIEGNKDNLTEDFLALLNDVCKMSPENGINGRGYLIVDENGIQHKQIVHITQRRPLVINFRSEIVERKVAFTQLFKIKPFKESIKYANEVLKSVSFDLFSYLKEDKEFENNSERILITILMQIAIVDTLKYLGLRTDKIIAESIGQISGDYFDECLSNKEAVLIAFWISKCFETQNHLQCNQQIINSLNDIIKNSKKRSSKWANGWAESVCSIEGYIKKADETEIIDQLISEDSFILDISGKETTLNSIFYMFGDIFNSGCNLMLENLYPKVTYPVSRETDSLSHLWKWNHSQSWLITKFPDFFCSMKLGLKRTVDLSDQFWRSIDGHSIDKRLLFPATGYLLLMWSTVATSFDNLDYVLNFSIEFKNVKFKRATIVPKIGTLHFNINYIPETGEFEIIEGGSTCVTGNMIAGKNCSTEATEKIEEEENSSAVTLNSKEIYRELRTRGYDYGPNFRCLLEAKSDGSAAKVKWNGNWINFADSVLQLSILEQTDRCLFIPTSIDYLKVNADAFRKVIENADTSDVIVDVKNVNRNYSVANGAMVIKNIIGTPTSRKLNDQIPDLEQIRFVPLNETVSVSELNRNKANEYIKTCEKLFQALVSRKHDNNNVSIDEESFKEIINNSSHDVSLLKMLYEMYTENSLFENGLMEKYKNEISKDFVMHLTESDLFQPFLDLIPENLFSKTMAVIEFNLSTNILYDLLNDQNSRNQLDYNYKLLHRLPFETTSVPSNLMHLWRSEDNVESFASNVDLIILRDWSNSLIIAKDLIQEKFDLKSFLDSSFASIKPGGFLLLNFRENLSTIETQILNYQKVSLPQFLSLNEAREIIETTEFCVIGERSDQFGNTTILVRKRCEQKSVENQTVVDLRTYDYNWVEDLKEAVKKSQTEKIWLRAADSELNGVIGLFNCLKREIGEMRLRCIFGENVKLSKEVIEKDLAVNVFKNGVWGSMRSSLVDVSEHVKESEFAYLDVQTKGDLSSLKWHESSLALQDSELNENDVICNVSYAALNFKDVMVASGKVPVNVYPPSWSSGAAIGIEFSGRDENHNRICGVSEGGAIATKVKANQFVWEVPSNWSLEEAATVPVVYLTVYYALFIRGKIRRNESILIHAGSGGIGQAAIAVCLKMNCNVYTTVGTEAKKQFILQRFPELNEKHVGNSRDVRFEEMIMKDTNGRGVDLILNSLSEEKLRASVRCLADFGRFLEIGKYDIVINSKLESYLLERNIAFHTICVAHLVDEMKHSKTAKDFEMFRKLHGLIEKGMKNGEIKPLVRSVFEKDEYEKAIRFMANGKHIGKVLIKMNNDNETINTVLRAIPQTYFSSKKSYILIGGLGGFGLEVAYWMVTRGAKSLVITSRSGIKDNYQQFSINRLKAKGANVVVLKNGATNEAMVKDILDEALKLGELGGVFIMSLILKDSLLENQTVEMFNDVCSCKVNPTTLLDSLTRKMNIKLDYFVCFSSMVASAGNRTQTNYAFANSVMDRVCDKRRSDGLHGISIQWGLIGDVGFVAERFDDVNLTLRGSVSQRMPSCLQTLDKLMQTDFAVCTSIVRVKDSCKSAGKDDLKKQICHVLGIKNPEKVNLSATLGELGLDSLMAVEIKQTLERDYDLELSILEIRSLSLKQLMDIESNSNTSKANKQSETTSFWDKLFQVPSKIFVPLNKQTEGLPMFFVPPVDGNFDLMAPIANLSRPVIGINWTSALHGVSSISEAASFYAEELYKNYPQHEYEVIGYSFGAVVALELCVQLQSKYGQSIVKKVMLLDGSAKMLKTQLVDDIYSNSNSEDDETENFWDYLSYMLKVKSNDRVKHRDEIRSLPTKELKTEKVAEIVSTATGKECNVSSLKDSIEIFAQKSRLLYKHETQKKFVGKVTLLRAKEKSLVYDFKDYDEEDYGLLQEIDGQLNVITLKGFHETFIASNIDKILAQIEDDFTFFLV